MSDIDELFETLTNLQRSKRLPPLHLWQPEHEGVIDIRIDREGAWYHEGVRIQRQPLVDLFATILRREGDDYFLVTPAEKMKIEVEEAPVAPASPAGGGTPAKFSTLGQAADVANDGRQKKKKHQK